MARLDQSGIMPVTLAIDNFAGQNTAVQFSQIGLNQSPSLQNLLPNTTGSLANRKGTIPITHTPAANPLKRIFPYRAAGVDNIVASGGTTLYKYDSVGFDWDAQTMTSALVTDNINAVQYLSDAGAEVLVIADGGSLKSYNGTAVTNITPAANDVSPLPPNDLATINADFPPIGVTVHSNRLVIWSANSDYIFHSKPGFFDYFPDTNFQRWVRYNDYVQTCISFGSSLLIFMRHHIGVLFGDGYSPQVESIDWRQDFLDTTDGCVNPRSVQIVVFPDLHEEVFYQTDRGVSSVLNVDTKSLDNSTAFATRDVTHDKIDWQSLGITNAEWASAVSYFTDGKYWLIFKQSSTWLGLVYDATSNEWFPIKNVRATDFYADENRFYFLGADAVAGHLCAFDTIDYDVASSTGNVVQDFDNYLRTVGTSVEWFWYSKLLNPVLTGFKHLWDIMMIECRQFASTSSIDVQVQASNSSYNKGKAITSSFLIIGFSVIGEAEIANFNFTDIINNAKRLRIFQKSQYIQIKLSNSVGNPVELYNLRVEVRPQTYIG